MTEPQIVLEMPSSPGEFVSIPARRPPPSPLTIKEKPHRDHARRSVKQRRGHYTPPQYRNDLKGDAWDVLANVIIGVSILGAFGFGIPAVLVMAITGQ